MNITVYSLKRRTLPRTKTLPLESSISQQYFIFLSSLQSKMPTLILTHLITLLIEKFLFLIQELKALFLFIHLDSGITVHGKLIEETIVSYIDTNTINIIIPATCIRGLCHHNPLMSG